MYPMKLLPLIPSDPHRCHILLCPVLDPEEPPLAFYDLLLSLSNLLARLSLFASRAVALRGRRKALLDPLSTSKDASFPANDVADNLEAPCTYKTSK